MKLRIMSNNLWWCDVNTEAWAKNGEDCSAAARAGGFNRVYRELSPDIIGLQEVSALMYDELFKDWNDECPYAIVWGHDTPVLYKKDRFDLIDYTCMVYPEELPGREGSFNNLRTKSYGLVVLRDKLESKTLIFATTHLWYKEEHEQKYSDEARVYQLGLCMDKADEMRKKYGCPAVIVGDLNVPYDTAAVTSAIDRGYLHAHDIATEYAAEDHGYHTCNGNGYRPYEPKPFREGIDHILVAGAPDGFVRRFERYYSDAYLPISDHFPVYIDVEL